MNSATRSRLQDRTRHLHERLHRDSRLAGLAGGCLDRDSYAEALTGLLHGFGPLEDALRRSPWASGRLLVERTNRLRADLAALGLPAAEIARADAHDLAELAQEDDFLGHWYVHAGSALGGAMIHAALERRGRPWPRSFFAGDGEGERLQWRACRADLDAVEDESRIERVETAAKRAFEGFSVRFEQAVQGIPELVH